MKFFNLSFFLTFVCFLISGKILVQSKFQNIVLQKPKEAYYTFSQVEPCIAINPSNSNEQIAGSVMNDYYYSSDKGKTWTSTSLYSKFGVNGDPVLLFDKYGFAYYFHLSNVKNGNRLDRLVCQKTEKLEGNWNDGTYPNPNGTKAQDKQWVSYSHKKDEIYMTWTQFDKYDSNNEIDSSIILFSKTSDGAKTWSEPKRISTFAGDCMDNDKTVEGAVSSVGINGEILVVWSSEKGLCLQKSVDGGQTWLKQEKIIQNLVEGWALNVPGINRCNGFPVLVCDTSNSKNRGRFYLNWSDQRFGQDNTDSFIAYTDDLGETWSVPKKVSQENTKSHQFFTWMAVDPSNGNVYVVYFDRRNYSDLQTDVYVSISKDGAATFEDVRVSEKPFIPDEKIFFGDYISISAVNGVVRPIWPRMDNGKISLLVGLLDF